MFTGLFINSLILAPYYDQSHIDLVWDIAAGPSAIYSPNIMSELSYENIKSRGIGLNVAHLKKISDHWALYLEGDYSDTSIKSGQNQDSDYFGDNRTEEFSRSYADISGDSSKRTTLTIGLKTRWLDTKGHYFTMLFGHQQQKLNVSVKNGVQHIPVELSGTALTGLNSTYNSDFSSWYSGIATEHVFKWGTIGLRYERHDVEFDAEANWNLRDDFAHPISFSHLGQGKGRTVTLGYTYLVNFNFDVYFNYSRRDYDIKNGYDQTYFSDGDSYITSLNRLEYKSNQYQLGFRYIF